MLQSRTLKVDFPKYIPWEHCPVASSRKLWRAEADKGAVEKVACDPKQLHKQAAGREEKRGNRLCPTTFHYM